MTAKDSETRTGSLWAWLMLLCFGILGVALRLYRITEPDFVFYDEGYYLNYLRPFGEIFQSHLIGAHDLGKALPHFFRICLASGKSLWFMLVDSRIFWGGLYQWSFSRVLASFFGILSLGMTWIFCQRYYRNRLVSILSVVILAVLPSHVFYSRVGLQEAFSTFLVLAGFYFYLFPRHFGWRTIAAGILFGAAFFSNYRLIILPGIILAAEISDSLAQKKRPSARRYVWTCLTFFCCVFLIGNLFNGVNTWMTFSWMFHQGQMAEQDFAWVNLLSYPYYVFRLESVLLGLLFFLGNAWLFYQRRWNTLLPVTLVILQMAVFSLAAEKGARYLCVVLPFLVMSTAQVLTVLWQEKSSCLPTRLVTVTLVFIMLWGMTNKSIALALSRSGYRQVAEDLKAVSPHALFLSTQPYVQNLYFRNSKQVLPCPKQFEALLVYVTQGARYLVLGPQAFISYTPDEDRFLPVLDGYLGFLRKHAPVWRRYSNFEPPLLERFVFEHSDHLIRSIKFLQQSQTQDFGEIRVYDLARVVPGMLQVLSQEKGGGLNESGR